MKIMHAVYFISCHLLFSGLMIQFDGYSVPYLLFNVFTVSHNAEIVDTCINKRNLFYFQCVKFHPNSNYIATGSNDRVVRLWDILNGNCVRVFTGHKVGDASLKPLLFTSEKFLQDSQKLHHHE